MTEDGIVENKPVLCLCPLITMLTDDFDYHLPEALIAQRPAEQRTPVVFTLIKKGDVAHHVFSGLVSL